MSYELGRKDLRLASQTKKRGRPRGGADPLGEREESTEGILFTGLTLLSVYPAGINILSKAS